MAVVIENMRRNLREFRFEDLFREDLGWDTYRNRLPVAVDGQTYDLRGRAQKRGLVVLECLPGSDGKLPDSGTRAKIEHQVAKVVHEHVIIYTDAGKTQQVWQWVKREPGRPAVRREQRYHAGQSGQPLVERLQAIKFELDEEDRLNIVEVEGRVRATFDVERITKRFYDRFKTEHDAFRNFIKGMQEQGDRDWYASLMLNRLMFVYFIQKRKFLDGDVHYLRHRLEVMRTRRGEGQFHSFYRYFLLRLFHEGLGAQQRDPELEQLLGKVPYLNGGLFDEHQLESANPELDIPDEAFEKIFNFFDGYHWHLDERPLRDDREINPDVLGYIFEKYINQKQMGAYYTKGDITEYISKNTIIPFLFDAAKKKVPVAFEPGAYAWRLLQETPDRYIYDAVRKGVVDEKGAVIPLPEEIEAGVGDVSKRGDWNRPATEVYALPTETWREHVARRRRCLELREKLRAGEVREINDLITHNLDIRRFAVDVIEYAEGPDLVRAFYRAITSVTVLDPTCGSGAFLFAALNILEPLYEACLERMEGFVGDLERSGEKHHPEKFSDFKQTLARVAEHPNRKHFILKSIILNNLYGVDIMEEAVEIAKLRLFLKLVAHVHTYNQIEPLPDIDFNIRAGNTLIGFATHEDVKRAAKSRMDFGNALAAIDEEAEIADRAFQRFHEMQNEHGMKSSDFTEAKADLRERLEALNDQLDRYLASEYGIDESDDPKSYPQRFAAWRQSHQPFHWFVDFYGIMTRGGFDVIIGNPPYVQYKDVQKYRVLSLQTLECKDLYAFTLERAVRLVSIRGRLGFIVPLSAFSVEQFDPLQRLLRSVTESLFISHWSGDAHPSKLFEGVDKRLEIVLAQRRGTSTESTLCTSKYLKWYSAERSNLFSVAPVYERISEINQVAFFKSSLPKVHTDIELSVLSKLRARRTTIGELLRPGGEHVIYYTRKASFFLQFLNFVPEVRDANGVYREPSELKVLAFPDRVTRDLCLGTLSSSLFYWYNIVNSDCRNLNKREVVSFPVPHEVPRDDCSKISSLVCELMSDYQRNSVLRTVTYQGTRVRLQCNTSIFVHRNPLRMKSTGC